LAVPGLPACSIMRRQFHSATFGLLIGCGCLLGACSSSQPANAGAGDSAATAGSGNTVGCRAEDADVYAPGLEKPGTAGHFAFTLVSSNPAPPAVDDNRFVVAVSDADGNPLDGNLSVTLDMPEHGHSGIPPESRFDSEQKAFILEPLRLFMVGLWRFSFEFEATVAGAPVADSAVFEFCVD